MWILDHGFRLVCISLLLFIFGLPSYALHESDVGVVDWHKLLIGVPLVGTTVTAPVFHPVPGTNTSIILTATSNNVFAALDPVNGTILWRYIHEPEDRIAGFYRHENVVATLSGPGGSYLRLFDALTGYLTLERRLHAPASGHLSEPHHLGKHVAFDQTSAKLSVYVLTNGHTVTCIDGTSGEMLWTWSSPDRTSLTIYSHVIPTQNALYLVGISKSFSAFTLQLTVLHPETGALLATQAVPSSIKAYDGFLPLFNSGDAQAKASPHVLWLEDGALKLIALTSNLRAKPTVMNAPAMSFEGFIDVGIADRGHVMAVATDGTEVLIRLDEKNGINSVRKFEGDDKEERTGSTWAGGVDAEGRIFATRVYWSHAVQKTKAETFKFSPTSSASPLVEELGAFFDFDTASHGVINHIALSTLPSTNTVSVLLTTSSGAIQLWHVDPLAANEKWTREESLAGVVVAEFVELPEAVGSTGVGGEKGESFLSRVTRQIGDAKNFPQYAISFAKRFVTGSYASPSSAATPTSNDISAIPVRDTFGFRQVLVMATMFGKVYGLDSGNGRVLWSRVLGLGWAAEVGASVQPAKLFVFEEGDGNGPQVVLIAQRRAENTLVDTVVFHIDALTGADASPRGERENPPAINEVLTGLDIISGPAVEAFLLSPPPHTSKTNATTIIPQKVVLLLDEYLQVYLYPDTPSTHATFRRLAPTLNFPLRANTDAGGQRRLLGHKLVFNPDLSNRYIAYPTWTLSLAEGEDVKTLVPAARGPVASLGKVLGNRTTLYKYLNPRLFVLLTAPRVASDKSACGVYVVDEVKGSVVYRAALPLSSGTDAGMGAGVGVCDVKASLVENWLVYHYYDADYMGMGQTKGWRMVTVELYEGKGVDEKTMSSDMSSFSDESVNVLALEQAYVFPHGITALAPTSTKFGITNKDIIVASRNHQIQSIPRRLLNPRRPNRKVTAEEQEEFLIPYDPVLAYDPKRVLSHNYEVANIQRIVTAPALLESTSLVFVYGLDMFLTRVTPSNTFDVLNENFNKAQLVLIVSGLALAIMVTKPMVRRKRLREKWYQ